jgi:hypothetical protein
MAVTSWRRAVVLGGLTFLGVCAIPADVAKTVPSRTAVEDRRLIIRSGTMFTKDGVPISLAGFEADIESDTSPQEGNAIAPKHIKDVIVRSGTAFVRARDLGRLLQTRIKNDKVTDLVVATAGNEIKISGRLKKALPVHFEIEGPVGLTQDGLIDLHENSMKVDKLPMKGLSEMLGIDPGHVVGNDSGKGVQGNKDEILVDPQVLWGMTIQGRVTAVKVVNDGLQLVYGTSRGSAGNPLTKAKAPK